MITYVKFQLKNCVIAELFKEKTTLAG